MSARRASWRVLLGRWAEALRGCNVAEVHTADFLSRWLVISRACVLSMTASSALIGVLLAAEKAGVSGVSWLAAALCTAGLLAAHLSNNLLNDWTDTRRGVDTEDYPRAKYSTHPILGGLTTPRRLLAASLPYGLAVASVLVGKHIDKLEADRKAGVRSVPVLLGERRSRVLALGLFTAFYVLTAALAALRLTGPLVLLILASLPRLVRVWKIYRRPRPAEPPKDWTVWPLWYVGWAMYLNRLAGMLLVAGLLGNVLLRVVLTLVR
jgi:1,4-dihydroxy-2-naphthoate octaprenyltransferase